MDKSANLNVLGIGYVRSREIGFVYFTEINSVRLGGIKSVTD